MHQPAPPPPVCAERKRLFHMPLKIQNPDMQPRTFLYTPVPICDDFIPSFLKVLRNTLPLLAFLFAHFSGPPPLSSPPPPPPPPPPPLLHFVSLPRAFLPILVPR